MDAIAKTETRPVSDDRLALEITFLSGHAHRYEIDAANYYRVLRDILVTEKPPRIAIEPIEHPSAFEPTGNPS